MRSTWDDFSSALENVLGVDDDVRLWEIALDEVFRDAEFLCRDARTSSPIYARIGRCSHWLSPHNKGSLLPDARFAWPSGYGGGVHSIFGLPEFDWSTTWQWIAESGEWRQRARITGRRPLTIRVALPSRSARHVRAVVHAIWLPGSPTIPDTKLLQAYGFLRSGEDWELASTFGKCDAYETKVKG